VAQRVMELRRCRAYSFVRAYSEKIDPIPAWQAVFCTVISRVISCNEVNLYVALSFISSNTIQ